MGQCCAKPGRPRRYDEQPYASGGSAARLQQQQHAAARLDAGDAAAVRSGETAARLATIGLDVAELVDDTLRAIGTLVTNEQEPPASMLKLNVIAERDQGWLLVVQTMVQRVPLHNPLGPAVITLFLDESPLPTRDTVSALLSRLDLSGSGRSEPSQWHRNVCIVLSAIAEKLAGGNCATIFTQETLDYLLSNLDSRNDPNVILFSLIALEKYAQTTVNRANVSNLLAGGGGRHPLLALQDWHWQPSDADAALDPAHLADALLRHQVAFCATWALDNLFDCAERVPSHESCEPSDSNAILNYDDASEYLKLAVHGLEARCDVATFESVRSTALVDGGASYYEVHIVTPGVMQIGWATKRSKFFNHEGYGIGDDAVSVAYDGCRQLIWHAANSYKHNHRCWRPGDVLGCLLDTGARLVDFSLNGEPLQPPHTALFAESGEGFYAAASFMSFQQCRFNFGATPFAFPPRRHVDDLRSLHQRGNLPPEHRVIVPRKYRLSRLRSLSVGEGACHVCYARPAAVQLQPCGHAGLCAPCAHQLDVCPLCRARIQHVQPHAADPHSSPQPPAADPVTVEDVR